MEGVNKRQIEAAVCGFPTMVGLFTDAMRAESIGNTLTGLGAFEDARNLKGEEKNEGFDSEPGSHSLSCDSGRRSVCLHSIRETGP